MKWKRAKNKQINEETWKQINKKLNLRNHIFLGFIQHFPQLISIFPGVINL